MNGIMMGSLRADNFIVALADFDDSLHAIAGNFQLEAYLEAIHQTEESRESLTYASEPENMMRASKTGLQLK